MSGVGHTLHRHAVGAGRRPLHVPSPRSRRGGRRRNRGGGCGGGRRPRRCSCGRGRRPRTRCARDAVTVVVTVDVARAVVPIDAAAAPRAG